jgi:putative heme iron utilization protein
MNPEHAQTLRSILSAQQVAALGTLHEGVPYVSMVPFAMLRDGSAVIHVSALAAHTRAMLAEPAVSLLVMAPPSAGVLPQALPRVTIQALAASCGPVDPRHAEARAAYLGRFADSEPMFSFGDFSLFVLAPQSLRLVAGFAQAHTLAPTDLAAALR